MSTQSLQILGGFILLLGCMLLASGVAGVLQQNDGGIIPLGLGLWLVLVAMRSIPVDKERPWPGEMIDAK